VSTGREVRVMWWWSFGFNLDLWYNFMGRFNYVEVLSRYDASFRLPARLSRQSNRPKFGDVDTDKLKNCKNWDHVTPTSRVSL
jgi:hypothetical protein